MGITNKRIWIFLSFSIALNIGFIITVCALSIKDTQIGPSKDQRASEILSKIDVPPDEKEYVKRSIERLRDIHMGFITKLRKNQEEIFRLLCQPSPVDRQILESVFDNQHQYTNDYTNALLDHILAIRDVIGDVKSAQLFSELGKRPKRNGPRNRSRKGHTQP